MSLTTFHGNSTEYHLPNQNALYSFSADITRLPNSRLSIKENGEIRLIQKTPAEVVGEKLIKPVIDKVSALYAKSSMSFNRATNWLQDLPSYGNILWQSLPKCTFLPVVNAQLFHSEKIRAQTPLNNSENVCLKLLPKQNVITSTNHNKNKTNHAKLAESFKNRGDAYNKKKQFAQAKNFYLKALKAEKFHYGQTTLHLEIANSLGKLGGVYFNLNQFNTALKYFIQALEMRMSLFEHNPDYSSFAHIITNIAGSYLQLENNDKAIECFIKALEWRIEVHNIKSNHIEIIQSYDNLGGAYFNSGQYQKAQEYFILALEMNKNLYQEEAHLSIADSYNRLSLVHYKMDQNIEAKKYLQKALLVQESMETPDDLLIVDTLNNLGSINYNMGFYEQAKECFTASLKITQKIYKDQPNHPLILEIQGNLQLLEPWWKKWF